MSIIYKISTLGEEDVKISNFISKLQSYAIRVSVQVYMCGRVGTIRNTFKAIFY